MAIFLTEKLSTLFSAPEGKTLAYFFCDSSFDNRKTATSIIRGLLLQLVQQHRQLLAYIVPKYNERGAGLFKSFDALWTIFMAAAADQKTGRKYCVIDALDECDRESQKILLQQFQETFYGRDAPSNIRILVTSRPYSEIREYLDQFANKDLASFPQTNEDIDRCIEERVVDLVKKKRYTDKVKHQVSNILRDKAEGTFLWVGLACEELKEIPSKDAVKVLQNMPKGLHSLYKTLLETAQKESEADVIQRILGLVAVCIRPLSVLELSEACQLHEEEEDIETRVQYTRDQIASCRLMIIIQDEDVLLLHQSVKDYLVGASSDYFIDELQAHANIVYRCVNLLIEEFYDGDQSNEHFFPYAVENWPDHARMAESRFEVRDSEAEFFEVDSPSRQYWLDILSDLWPRLEGSEAADSPSPHMSILHIAGRWGIDSLVDYITNQYCQESSSRNLVSVIDLDCVDLNNDSATPMEMAARWGYTSVISKLLGLGAEATETVVFAALINWRNRDEVMAFLFDQVNITEDMFITIANRSNKEVMAMLFDRRGDEIIMTEDIVKAAAGNSESEVMALLLDQRGDQIIITEDIVKVAAGNSRSEMMALLLDRRGDEIFVTEDIVKAAAGNYNSEVLALLFDQRGDQIIITEDIVKAAAKSSTGKIMALLVDWRGDEIIMTEEIVKAAVGNRYRAKEIITSLLDLYGDQITITEDVVKEAAKKTGSKVMAVLFDRRGDEITITEDIVKAAAGTWEDGEEIITLLLDRCGDQIMITEDIVKAAVGNPRKGKKIITLLLDRYGDHITMTEDIVKAAVGNPRKGKKIITLLLDRRGNQITITEDVVEAAATSGQVEILDILSQQSLIISDWDKWYRISNFYKAASDGDVHTVEQLLDQGVNPDLKSISGVTPLWIAAAHGNETVVKILARRPDVNINSRSNSGETPLFCPSSEADERITRILIEAGADPHIVDENGETAITIAREFGCDRVLRILERAE